MKVKEQNKLNLAYVIEEDEDINHQVKREVLYQYLNIKKLYICIDNIKHQPETFYHEDVDYEVLWILDKHSPKLKKTDFEKNTFDKTRISNIKECSIPAVRFTPRQ